MFKQSEQDQKKRDNTRPIKSLGETDWQKHRLAFKTIVMIQLFFTSLFLFKTLSDLVGLSLAFIPWIALELVDVLTAIGMLLGVFSGFLLINDGHMRLKRSEERMNAAATELHDHLSRQFESWGLTPTEKDVALYVIKGFSNVEIATLRGTTESTTKSQVSAIFRKSGVSSRQQLATWAVDDLIEALGPKQDLAT